MHVERYGSGPRLFFGLHGWSGDHGTFRPLADALPDDCSFYSADLPGCGESKPPREWTIRAVAGEIAETIAKLPEAVTLVGNCSGANIGFFVAQQLPARIERIVTIDAFAFWPWYFRVFTNRAFGRYAYFSTFENPVGRWITNRSLSSKRQETSSLTDGFSRVDHATTYRYLTMLKDGGEVNQFRGLTMPIDLTYGERSFAGVKESAAQFRTLWPQARMTPLPGAGHLPILEATAALRGIIFSPTLVSQPLEDFPCPTSSTISAS